MGSLKNEVAFVMPAGLLRVHLTLVVLTSTLAGSTAGAADETPQRTIRFPAERAVGIVLTRPARTETYKYTMYVDWRALGEAKGEVSVPADTDVRLDVSKAASQDLAFLAEMNPDDIQVLDLANTEVNDEGLRFVGRMTGLRMLSLQDSHITDAGVRHLGGLRHLQELDLDAYTAARQGFGVGDEGLRALALGRLTELKAISLRRTKVSDEGLAALSLLRSLESISIPGTRVSDAGLAHLARLPHLDNLRLGLGRGDGTDVTDAGMVQIAEMSQLRQLDLSGTKITNDGLRHLHKLTGLEGLTLDDTAVTEAGLAELAPLASLSDLRFYPTRGSITDVGAKHLSKLKSLTRLTSNLRVTAEGLAALSELAGLKDVSLAGPGITNESLTHLARMKSLTWVSISSCPVTDSGLAALGELTELEVLSFAATQITGEGLRHLKGCSGMRHMNLHFNDRGNAASGELPTLRYVTDFKRLKGLAITGTRLAATELAHLDGMALETLSLDQTLVDDRAAFHIAGLPSLKVLIIPNSGLTDEGLKRLSILRNLETLRLTGHFTTRGLDSLKRLRSLNRLHISSPYVTNDDVQALAAAMPSLQEANYSEYSGDRLDLFSISEKDVFRREGSKKERVDLDALESRPPPALTVTDWLNAGDEGLTFDKLRGKVVLVDFWVTWRPECVQALPTVQRLHETYAEKGLTIVGIHATQRAETMKAFAAANKIPWALAADVNGATTGAWHVRLYPGYFLIDRTGTLRAARIYPGDLDRAIRELLDEK